MIVLWNYKKLSFEVQIKNKIMLIRKQKRCGLFMQEIIAYYYNYFGKTTSKMKRVEYFHFLRRSSSRVAFFDGCNSRMCRLHFTIWPVTKGGAKKVDPFGTSWCWSDILRALLHHFPQSGLNFLFTPPLLFWFLWCEITNLLNFFNLHLQVKVAAYFFFHFNIFI